MEKRSSCVEGYVENTVPTIKPILPPPNPAYKTNDLLKNLTENISRLVASTEQHSQIFKSLVETANLSYAEAASASNETRRATQLTKYGVFIAAMALLAQLLISVIQSWQTMEGSRSNDEQLTKLTTTIEDAKQIFQNNGTAITEQLKSIARSEPKSSASPSKRKTK